MFARDIEAIFTEKVNEYIQKGYVFSPATMSGHQGEIGKVDLRNGNEIVRVLLTSERDYRADTKAVLLTVGRVERKERKGYEFDTMAPTIWNNKLDVIEQRTFYMISDKDEVFTEDPDEYEAVAKKQNARMHERYSRKTKRFTSDAMRKAVLPFVRRQDKCKRMKLSDIKAIAKVERGMFGEDRERYDYRVELTNGKTFKLS